MPQLTDDITADEIGRYRTLAADPPRRRSDSGLLVASYYAMVTDVYGQTWGPSHHFGAYRPGQSREEAILETEHELAHRAGITAGSRALDVGSGVGGPACAIAAYTEAHVVGVDLVPARVRRAQDRAEQMGLAGQVEFHEGDAMSLPFPDSSFDAAYSFEIMCHVPDRTRAHSEAARILRPGAVWTGYEWMRGDNLDARGEELVETICQTHALPALTTAGQLHEDLVAAGLTDIEVFDAGTRDAWEPNWSGLEAALEALLPAEEQPPLPRMMAEGGLALCEAARSGAFVIGAWWARKPERGRP